MRGKAGCILGQGRVAAALALFQPIHRLGGTTIAHQDLAGLTTDAEREAHVAPAEPMEAMPAAQAVAVVLPERSRRTVRPDAGPDPPSIGPPPTGPT